MCVKCQLSVSECFQPVRCTYKRGSGNLTQIPLLSVSFHSILDTLCPGRRCLFFWLLLLGIIFRANNLIKMIHAMSFRLNCRKTVYTTSLICRAFSGRIQLFIVVETDQCTSGLITRGRPCTAPELKLFELCALSSR